MRTRFHVTDDGRVLECNASLKSCTYSSRNDERHFNSIEEADRKSAEMLSGRYGKFASVRRRRRTRSHSPLSDLDFDAAASLSLYVNHFPTVPKISDNDRFAAVISGPVPVPA